MRRQPLKTTLVMTSILVFAAAATGTSRADDWSAWEHRMPVKLFNRDAPTSGLVPVDVTFSLFADEVAAPERELRLVRETSSGLVEVPFQLSGLSRWTKDTADGKSRPTVNGMMTFFDDAPGDGDVTYYILYGNPRATTPSYQTDLVVTGSGPSWTIANDVMTVRLHGRDPSLGDYTNHDSGQLAAVVLKSAPDSPIAPSTGVMHWNPGIFVPARGWIHSFAWDPPEECTITTGPLFVEVRRSGIFPGIPEVRLSVTYRIFTGRGYVESGTVMTVEDDIGVVALRNNQLVFDGGTFTRFAHPGENGAVVRRFADHTPVNSHGDIMRLPDTIPYVTFLNPERGVGTASVAVSYSNIGPGGSPPTLFDNATYITNSGHGLQYFFRPLVYFHVDWDRKQLITVPRGSVYAERNLYLFYNPPPDDPVGPVTRLARAVDRAPAIAMGPYDLPPDE